MPSPLRTFHKHPEECGEVKVSKESHREAQGAAAVEKVTLKEKETLSLRRSKVRPHRTFEQSDRFGGQGGHRGGRSFGPWRDALPLISHSLTAFLPPDPHNAFANPEFQIPPNQQVAAAVGRRVVRWSSFIRYLSPARALCITNQLMSQISL